jgi:hypothetical protein
MKEPKIKSQEPNKLKDKSVASWNWFLMLYLALWIWFLVLS